jgi:sigma-E factor negative regulatory protein RseA
MNELNSTSSSERLSAFMDGELSVNESAQVLDRLLVDTQAKETWHAYQVVGDVLRSAELAPNQSDLAFLEKLEHRLSQEPQRPVVSGARQFPVTDVALVLPEDLSKPVANSPVFRWKVLAGVACSALVIVVGGGLWSQTDPLGGGQLAIIKPVISEVPVVVATETSAGPMLRDPRLDELMTAHRQLGGHSALQVPAGFLRNATYEGAGR